MMRNPEYDPYRSTPDGLVPGRDISVWLWWVPAIALLVAILPLPYGYYMLLRVVVCAAAGFIAWKEYDLNGKRSNSYSWIFGVIAALFNPLIPAHLFKLLWVVINIITALTFIGHFRLRLRQI